MAKQQRRPGPTGPGKAPATSRRAEAARPTPTSSGGQRSSYIEAVALYEQAMRTLQQKNFRKAAELLRHVLTAYPEERELLERVRLYLAMCERQIQPVSSEPRTVEELLYAATLVLNAGDATRALEYLDRVAQAEPDNDQALYMRAIAHAERGEHALAVGCLRRAIEANGENRSLARLDPDLETLRTFDGVAELLGGSGLPAGDSDGDARRR